MTSGCEFSEAMQRECFTEEGTASWLERCGWRRVVAGDYDFGLAVQAVHRVVHDPSLGLMLIGRVGVGKTMLADIVWRHLTGERMRVECADDDQVDFLVPRCDANQNGGVYSSRADDLLNGSVYFDDLGSESLRQSYGNILDRCGRFIAKYHSRGRGRLIVTTNLDGKALGEKYGDRVLDRLIDKCVVVKYGGWSKRERNVLK